MPTEMGAQVILPDRLYRSKRKWAEKWVRDVLQEEGCSQIMIDWERNPFAEEARSYFPSWECNAFGLKEKR